MATERQIAANRRNSALSTGPKTPEGKARSRANAVAHGMAGASPEVAASASPGFLDRREKWGAEYRPVGEAAAWALDKAVAASLRIDSCERAMLNVVDAHRRRAELAWDQDRAFEAAATFGRLGQDPLLAARQLETSLAGVDLLIDAWRALAAPLRRGVDWSEAEASRALDLLGVAAEGRAWDSPIDLPGAGDAVAFRRALAFDEVERLEALRDSAMVPLDDLDREIAMAGDAALLDRPARLVRRYEREAWRQYRESIRALDHPDPAPPPVAAPPPPPVAVARVAPPPPPDDPPAEADPVPPVPREWRSLRDQAARVLANFPGARERAEAHAQDDQLDAIERQLAGRGRGRAPERSQFGRAPTAQ